MVLSARTALLPMARILFICAAAPAGVMASVVPEYIEKVIKGKSTRDEQSIDMLEIIFQNRIYDLGLINDWGKLASGFMNLVFNNQNNYANLYKKVSKSAQNKLENFIKKITAS